MSVQPPPPRGTAKGRLIAATAMALGALAGTLLGFVLRLAAAVAHGAIARDKQRAIDEGRDAPRRPEPLKPGWSRPLPERLVRPTYWPMVFALGIAFLLWGAVSSPIISAIGLVLLVLALANWIGALRHDA